jgi:hypothetical protein
MNMYYGVIWNGSVSYINKFRTTKNAVGLIGINQYLTPLLTSDPENNLNFSGSVSKNIYRFVAKLKTNLGWYNYNQNINDVSSRNDRNSQNVGVELKTAYKKWPDVRVGYDRNFNQFRGITDADYKSESFNIAFEWKFFRNWAFFIQYENLRNVNVAQSNYYEIANTSLRYSQKDSAFDFELSVSNLTDNDVKNDYTFSDYLISRQKTYVLPRIFLFTVSYKL